MANLFNYDVNVNPAVMDIRSETLEPISSSTMRYVFRLDQAGQLDANSVLLFKPKLSNNGANKQHNQRVNPFAGGLLAIKRATFQVGDYILNDIHDIGRISTLVDMGTINSSNASKYNGHYFKNNFQYKVVDTWGTQAANAGGTETNAGGAGTIVYDRHRSGMDFGVVSNNAAHGKVNNCIITNEESTNHQIGIPLGNLFPCLKGQEIPLFLFQDYRILITVEFASCENWVNMARKDTNSNSQISIAGDVIPSEVKLQVDYIIYPSEVQNKMREQTNAQGGLSLSFFDIIKVEKQIPAVEGADDAPNSGLSQIVEHRIGADNKEVHSIYMLKQLVRANPNADDRMFLNARCDGMNQEEYNVSIDGMDVFQEAKWSPSSQYDETTNCLGDDMKVARPVYFNDENTYMSRLADIAGGLLGKNKPLCLDLKNGNGGVVGAGRNIGAYPIIWKYQRRPTSTVVNAGTDGTAAGNIINSLKGAMNVDYFIYCSRTANIHSTPSGTAVMVSY